MEEELAWWSSGLDATGVHVWSLVGELNGNPLQYSCLKNPMDRGAWWDTVRGVAKSQTRLANFTFTFFLGELDSICSQTFLKLRWGHEAYTHCGSDSKESACSAGDPGLIPGSRRSPGEGNGNPLQYPCLENSIDWGAWLATDHGVAESDTTEQLHFTNIINTSHSLSSFLTSNSQSVVLHPFYYHEYLKANPRYHVVSTENVLLQRRLWSHKLCSGMSSC